SSASARGASFSRTSMICWICMRFIDRRTSGEARTTSPNEASLRAIDVRLVSVIEDARSVEFFDAQPQLLAAQLIGVLQSKRPRVLANQVRNKRSLATSPRREQLAAHRDRRLGVVRQRLNHFQI